MLFTCATFIYLCLFFYHVQIRKYDCETNFCAHLYVKSTAEVTYMQYVVSTFVRFKIVSQHVAAPVKCADEYAEFSFCTVHKWHSSAGSHGFVMRSNWPFG